MTHERHPERHPERRLPKKEREQLPLAPSAKEQHERTRIERKMEKRRERKARKHEGKKSRGDKTRKIDATSQAVIENLQKLEVPKTKGKARQKEPQETTSLIHRIPRSIEERRAGKKGARTVVTVAITNPRDSIPAVEKTVIANAHTRVGKPKDNKGRQIVMTREAASPEIVTELALKADTISRLDMPGFRELRSACESNRPTIVVTPNTNFIIKPTVESRAAFRALQKKEQKRILFETLAALQAGDQESWERAGALHGPGGRAVLSPGDLKEADALLNKYQEIRAEILPKVLEEHLNIEDSKHPKNLTEDQKLRVDLLPKGTPIKVPAIPADKHPPVGVSPSTTYTEAGRPVNIAEQLELGHERFQQRQFGHILSDEDWAGGSPEEHERKED